ncbi:MAG: hypothetical protein WCI74_09680 [Actinomycetes bacterium]
MEIHDRLDDIARLLETARAVPLSTSCVVPRNEALDLVEDARASLPDSIREADDVLAEREDLIEDAEREAAETVRLAQSESVQLVNQAQIDADRIVDDARSDADEMLERARAEGRRMIDEQEVLLRAHHEAASLLEDAEARARSIILDAEQEADMLTAKVSDEVSRERLQTDEFVDGKLGDLEESLATSLAAVRRGRDRIHARRAAFDPVDLRTSTGNTSTVTTAVFDQSFD